MTQPDTSFIEERPKLDDPLVLLAMQGSALHRAVMVPHSQAQEKINHFLNNPIVGDLVMEPHMASLWITRSSPKRETVNGKNLVTWPGGSYLENVRKCIGYLEKTCDEPIAGEWDEKFEGRPKPLEFVYYIKTLDGEVLRWTNCTFIRLVGPHDYWEFVYGNEHV